MTVDATLDRLLRHMAWANQAVLESLSHLTSDQLKLTAPGSEWSVARIAHHLVDAQRWYVWRLAQDVCDDTEIPSSGDDVRELAQLMMIADARIREEAALADGFTQYEREGKTITRARSTILAQAIHHATEHRAQIADTLAAHGVNVIDLDSLDIWSFGSWEGLGE